MRPGIELVLFGVLSSSALIGALLVIPYIDMPEEDDRASEAPRQPLVPEREREDPDLRGQIEPEVRPPIVPRIIPRIGPEILGPGLGPPIEPILKPGLVTLPLNYVIRSPPERNLSPLAYEAVFDGERYIYAIVRTSPGVGHDCKIVRIDAFSILEMAPPAPDLIPSIVIWDFGVSEGSGDCDYFSARGEPHGIAIHDGYLWISSDSRFGAKISKLDLSTGEPIDHFEFQVPNSQFSARGPLRVGDDGFIYQATYQSWIVKFDPSSGEITILETGRAVRDVYADKHGFVYFTGGEGVGRINPDGTGLKIFTHSACNCKTGRIVVGPTGKIWFSYFEGKIGSLEPSTGKLIVHSLTTTGGNRTEVFHPFRLVFDREGILWIASSRLDSTGMILRYNPETEVTKVVDLIHAEAYEILAGPGGSIWALLLCGPISSAQEICLSPQIWGNEPSGAPKNDLPIIHLRYRGDILDGMRGSGCWIMTQGVPPICWNTHFLFPPEIIEVRFRDALIVEWEAHGPPLELTTEIWSLSKWGGNPTLIGNIELTNDPMSQFTVDLPDGRYIIVINGNWQDGGLSYFFQIKVTN